MHKLLLIFLISISALLSNNIYAEKKQSNKEADIGKPGNPAEISRTINITLLDNMFLPPELIVSEGEVIRFVLNNRGNNTHQFLIDYADELKKAANTKQRNKYLMRIKPGEKEELIWQFANPGTVDFACPLKNHFKTMRGRITVIAKN
ncbi:cupredoxin domain-containing protein [Nitrosomonas supralitoralis]|uniref:EfeO-type cupredoxin-like domain-containing protein n=1 Tax=Nitrosomonas supralitoralis TaxID=2116706 RepID=A0A2P7NZJ5_9PROT|nr:cupredoxin domain-containing protein [Nitrosomonas supralitoralis]PSJ18875.1 hypothetical protein C7H79_00050 [Nitrosomonas supralitoralis]